MGFNRKLLSPFLADLLLLHVQRSAAACSLPLLLSYDSQQMSEEFVHDTRCANISEALSVGIGQLSLYWLSWTSRHQSHVGAQTVISHKG